MQEEIIELREELEDKKLKKFNWGAFLGTWLWGIGNRINHWSVYVAFVIFVLQLIKIPVTGVVGLVLSIYMGIIGNNLAYNKSSKTYKDIDEFIDIQKKWAIWMLFFSIIVFAGSFIWEFFNNTTTVE